MATITNSALYWRTWSKQACVLARFACLLSVSAFAQTKPDVAINTTVCDIVKAPQDFYAKRVQLRARLWSDGKSFWLNDVGSLPIGKVCSWLPTDFHPSTNLLGSTALGTFTGTVVYAPTHQVSGLRFCMRFVVEQQSDIRDQEILNGPVIKPRLYDQTTGTFVQPESCLLVEESDSPIFPLSYFHL